MPVEGQRSDQNIHVDPALFAEAEAQSRQEAEALDLADVAEPVPASAPETKRSFRDIGKDARNNAKQTVQSTTSSFFSRVGGLLKTVKDVGAGLFNKTVKPVARLADTGIDYAAAAATKEGRAAIGNQTKDAVVGGAKAAEQWIDARATPIAEHLSDFSKSEVLKVGKAALDLGNKALDGFVSAGEHLDNAADFAGEKLVQAVESAGKLAADTGKLGKKAVVETGKFGGKVVAGTVMGTAAVVGGLAYGATEAGKYAMKKGDEFYAWGDKKLNEGAAALVDNARAAGYAGREVKEAAVEKVEEAMGLLENKAVELKLSFWSRVNGAVDRFNQWNNDRKVNRDLRAIAKQEDQAARAELKRFVAESKAEEARARVRQLMETQREMSTLAPDTFSDRRSL